MLWPYLLCLCAVIGFLITVGLLRRALRKLKAQRYHEYHASLERVQQYARQCALLNNELRTKTCQLENAETNLRRLIRVGRQVDHLHQETFRSGQQRGKIEVAKTLLAHLQLCQAHQISSEEIVTEITRSMQKIVDVDAVETLINSLPPRATGPTRTTSS